MIIGTIRDLFISRDDCFPMQIDGKNEYTVARRTLTDDVILDHLDGSITVGCWQTNPVTRMVKWLCFDFDGVLEEEFEKAKNLTQKFQEKGFHPVLEFSGRRGYHVWLFIEPVDIAVAYTFVSNVSSGASDVYPKSGKIADGGYGAQVKLPLGLHRVTMKRSYLFDAAFNLLSQNDSEKLLVDFNQTTRDKIQPINIETYLK